MQCKSSWLALLSRLRDCLRLQEVFDNILERRIEWPDDMSPGFRDLCDRLLCSDPGRRLGARGAGEVRFALAENLR